MTTPNAPFPYASALYGAREDLIEYLRPRGGKGQVQAGGRADASALQALERRINDLEADAGEGLAWTAVDAGRWRMGARRRVPIESATFSWVATAAEMAGTSLPAGWYDASGGSA